MVVWREEAVPRQWREGLIVNLFKLVGEQRLRTDCQMLQVIDMCPKQVSASILLRYLNDDGKQTDVLCSAYGDTVYHLANKPTSHQLVKQDLALKKFPQVQLPTGKNITTFALREV